MKKTKVIIITIFFIMMSTPVLSDDPPTIIEVGSKTTSPGEEVTIPIYCIPSEPIKAYEFSLSYDETVLQLISVEKGNFFDPYDQFFNSGTTENGTIKNIYNLIVGQGNVTEPGYLVNITFLVLRSGNSDLSLFDAGVTNEVEYRPLETVDGVLKSNSNFITRLVFEDIDAFWGQEGVFLENNYTNISLSAKQVFVPDELSELTEHFTYSLQEWHENQARFWVTLTYCQSYYGWNDNPQLYPDETLDTLLGNSQWTSSPYPANRFQISNKEVWATNQTEKGYVFDITDFTDETVEWNITVTSHYNHIIISYEIYYEEQVIYTFQDIYSGERPELLPIDFYTKKYYDSDQYVDKATLLYDNLYGENRITNVTIAYPKEKTLISFKSSTFSEFSENKYDEVISFFTAINRTESLLYNPDDYTFRSYSVNISENTVTPISFTIPSSLGEQNDLFIWALGSGGGGGETTTDWHFPCDNGEVFSEWVQPQNAYANDSNTAIGDSNKQDYSSFGFNIPAGVIIKGIEVQVKGAGDLRSPDPILTVNLTKNGGDTYSKTKTHTFVEDASSFEYITFGDSSALWGETWEPDDFANNTFFVSFHTDERFYIWFVSVKVTYEPPLLSPPTSFNAETYNNTRIDLSWTKGTNATHTIVENNSFDETDWVEFENAEGDFSNPSNAIDGNTLSSSDTTNTNDYLYLNTSHPVYSNKINIYASDSSDPDLLISVLDEDGRYEEINNGEITRHSYVSISFGRIMNLTSIRIKPNNITTFIRIYNVQYNNPPWNQLTNTTGSTYTHTELTPDTTYYYRARSYNSSTYLYNDTVVISSNTTTTITEIILTNPSVYPTTGVASYTDFSFNITWTHTSKTPLDGYLNVTIQKSLWSMNQSLSYVSGDNTTGAVYTYSTKLPAGKYTYTFHASDGTIYNSSGAHNDPTVDSQSYSFSITTSSDPNLDFKDWTLTLTGVGATTQYNVSEDNQTALIPALSITNTGNVPLNFSIEWTASPGSGISMKYAYDNTPGTNTIATNPSFITNLAPSSTKEVWLWMDFVSVSAQTENQDIKIESSICES